MKDMQIEKHKLVLSEVNFTIAEALNDQKGLLRHQRSITFMTSLGMQQMVELYFHKLNIIKPGAQIKHEWFGFEERNIRRRLSPVLTKDIAAIPKIQEILYLANKIESDRNEIVYGAPLKNDEKLKEKIDNFLELKNIIETEIGD